MGWLAVGKRTSLFGERPQQQTGAGRGAGGGAGGGDGGPSGRRRLWDAPGGGKSAGGRGAEETTPESPPASSD